MVNATDFANAPKGTPVSDFNETIVIQHTVSGALTVAPGAVPFPVPFPCELVAVSLAVGTAPTGADVTVDVNKNGTTVFADQNKRPKVAATKTTGGVTIDPALPAGTNYIYSPYPAAQPLGLFAAGDVITVDVDTVGSGTAGSNLGVVLTLAKK